MCILKFAVKMLGESNQSVPKFSLCKKLLKSTFFLSTYFDILRKMLFVGILVLIIAFITHGKHSEMAYSHMFYYINTSC